jgi:acyl-CoA reductase-like NAD-dependent aldehyde dehydrogenase
VAELWHEFLRLFTELDAALARSASALRAWSRAPLAERAEALRRLGGVLRARAAEDGLLMAEEMGKPAAQGKPGRARFISATCRR